MGLPGLWIVATAAVGALALPQEQDSFPKGESVFHHRAYHNSIVVGDYLYIDGGEIAHWSGEGDSYLSVYNAPENNTISIDLTTSWTNESVKLNSISKTAPVLISQALWLDGSNESFYAYDGGVSWSIPDFVPPSENDLWKFTPSGSSGSWSQVSYDPSSNFSSLTRVIHGNYASGNGLGFAIGGFQNSATSDAYTGIEYFDVPGMVIYNTSSQEWLNVSANGLSYTGTVASGVAHFAPSLGPEGILFSFGGAETADIDAGAQGWYPFDTVNMFDPQSQQWLTQTTTGDAPPESLNSCGVGLAGDNGTYEIFIYGGTGHTLSTNSVPDNVEATIQAGLVYVLSLPSFHWERQHITPTQGRYRHSCNIVGQRQMVVVGGQPINETSSDNYGSATVDPWPQGIGIFDLSKFDWSDSYDPDAAPYVTPQNIKNYIASNGRYPAEWSDDKVKALFTPQDKNSPLQPSSSSGSNDNSQMDSSTNVGAIAGGVVGGVVGLALIGALVWFLLRRKARKSKTTNQAAATDGHNEYFADNKAGLAVPPTQSSHGGHTYSELSTEERPPPYINELRGSNGGVELPAQGRQMGGQGVHELDASR